MKIIMKKYKPHVYNNLSILDFLNNTKFVKYCNYYDQIWENDWLFIAYAGKIIMKKINYRCFYTFKRRKPR
jgi:hypothetical protein